MSKKSEYFTIPNLMGYFRILLVPVFLVFFVKSERMSGYLIAKATIIAPIVILSAIGSSIFPQS
ncbi:MAG: hypothetical protein IJ889_04110, partial [Eubacterium sp.]|nr:hypothetical protein [Eubacterium sp.]